MFRNIHAHFTFTGAGISPNQIEPAIVKRYSGIQIIPCGNWFVPQSLQDFHKISSQSSIGLDYQNPSHCMYPYKS